MKNYRLNLIFNFLIIYYWGMIYIQAIPYLINTALLYFLYIFPIGIFIIYELLSLMQNKDFKFEIKIYYLLFFAFIVIINSLSMLDLKSIASISLFVGGMIIILKNKLFINLNLLNKLFLLSILLSIFCFYTRFSIYGFLPGQSTTTNSIEILAGRVSLFPNVSTSIYFSFLVFLLNLFFNNSKSKYFYILLSLYFIYFGISRTVILLIIFVILLITFKNFFSFKSIFFKIMPIIIIFLILLAIIYSENILNLFFNSKSEFIHNYILHGMNSIDQLYSINFRFIIWKTHLHIFISHPFGISAEYFDKLFYNLTNVANGSESFLTGLLAHYGYATILFYLFLFSILIESFKKNNFYWYIFIWVFLFIGFLYGSFFNIYNVLYLILLSSLNLNYYKEIC